MATDLVRNDQNWISPSERWIYFVRHAAVQVDPSKPASQWTLTEEGQTSCRALARQIDWPTVAFIAHSHELKARQTAEILAEASHVASAPFDGLGELFVPYIADNTEFRRRFAAYLAGYADPDFESWEKSTGRFRDAVDHIQSLAEPKRAVIVTHGRILTAYFSHIWSTRLDAAAWQSLQFPDLALYDSNSRRIAHGFFQGFSPPHP